MYSTFRCHIFLTKYQAYKICLSRTIYFNDVYVADFRSLLLNGTVCLDMAATSLDDICELALDNMINTNLLPYDKKALVKDAILKKHR